MTVKGKRQHDPIYLVETAPGKACVVDLDENAVGPVHSTDSILARGYWQEDQGISDYAKAALSLARKAHPGR